VEQFSPAIDIPGMSDTLTLVLDGTVTLDEFAHAVSDLRGLVGALADEVAPESRIIWLIEDLSSGSAISTIRGRGRPQAVGSVVGAYERVGAALERAEAIPFSTRVQKHAVAISELLNGRGRGGIESIRFETARADATIRHPSTAGAGMSGVAEVARKYPGALGAVEGIVETLSSRGGLRFTLYDMVHNKPVSCYLKPGYEEIMRELWGKRAMVTGNVNRDALSGRPISIRQVTEALAVTERNVGDWRKAKGILAGVFADSAEALVRAGRDG
jgi:hypothetical protein